MPNNIVLAKNYTALLDEVYRLASVTADLISDASMMRAGANANEILYPQIEVSGLGDYSRNSGYTDGTVNVVWKTTTFNYDRGTRIMVDTMDDQETFNIAFGMAGSTLQREKVAPEADAFTFATLAGIDGISKAAPATYADASQFLAALLEAKNKMDEDEVPEENRLLYATPTLLNSIMALDTTKSREILSAFSVRKSVPQSRFYTAINLLDGKTSGEELGHFKKADDGKDINFMIIHKPAIIKFDKHTASSIISPDNNPNADGYISKYRKYGLVDVYKNKVAGIYLSHKA
nr:MAG TPA: Major capsid protein [Caudoviricetes sp.]